MSILLEKKYNQELALKRMMDCVSNGINKLDEISKVANIEKSMVYYYLKILKKDNYITTSKRFSKELKKYIISVHLTDNKFEPKTREELQAIEDEKYARRSENILNKKGPYDDLIKSNPNLKLYRPLENGYKNVRASSEVNRRPGTSFALYDMY